MILAIDVDGVVADTMVAILHRYNRDYDDRLTLEDIKAYGVEKFVKPQCGSNIYRYFEDANLYNSIFPIVDSHYGITSLRLMGHHRVVFVTTPSPGTNGKKLAWLKFYGFLRHDVDYVECHDKSLIRADVMVDDKISNLAGFTGERIIFTQPWNKQDSVTNSYRANGWPDVIQIVAAIHRQKQEAVSWKLFQNT